MQYFYMDPETARRQLRVYRTLMLAEILLLVFSISCFLLGTKLEKNNYKRMFQTAQVKEQYLEVIRQYPQYPESYMRFLDACSEDGLFDEEESQAFQYTYHSNHKKLRMSDEQYGLMHYKAAMLYWNQYDGDELMRMQLSQPFLKEAERTLSKNSKEYQVTICCRTIAEWYQTYFTNTSLVERRTEKEATEKLVAGILLQLTEAAEMTDEYTLLYRLQFYGAVCDLMLDQRNILARNIEEETVEEVFRQIYQNLPKDTSYPEAETLIRQLRLKERTYKELMDRAYTGREGAA